MVSSLISPSPLALFAFLHKRHDKLISFKVLKSEILQAFREIGNAVCLINFIEDSLCLESSNSKILIQDVVSYGMCRPLSYQRVM